MKKHIIIAFALIFGLFTLGSAVTIQQLFSTTSNLRYLINLHEIEDIRQDLSFSIQKIQNYTYSSSEAFARNLDEVIANATVVDHTVEKCHECHHEPSVQAELDQIEEMVNDYKEKLSYLITTVADGERRQQLQKQVARNSEIIMGKVQGMVDRAAATIALRTDEAMVSIEHSYIYMGTTLLFTVLAALIVARYLIRKISKPIDELREATNRITRGDLGYQTNCNAYTEFNNLLKTFNEMSASLAAKDMQIKSNLARLDQLNLVTLPLHAAQDMSVMKNYLRTCMNALIAVEYNGIMLQDENGGDFTIQIAGNSPRNNPPITQHLEQAGVLQAFNDRQGQPVLLNNAADYWPFADKPAGLPVRNLLILWLTTNDRLTGALLAINKEEDFLDEDMNILGILANNIAVALQNIRLYRDLQNKMAELQKTQRQLVEAEKLTALGTLAGGVAHDFNNILCGMIGYVALIKKNFSEGDRDYKMLETVEKAGFRAANLTKQLLTFARQEKVEKRPVNLNETAGNVMNLLANTISKLIIIKDELARPLPLVLGDPAQLEQVVMNLCVNARDAMPAGGELCISTEKVKLDRAFCLTRTDAKPGNYVKMTVADQGSGIDEEDLSRIFEPFFTTKEFGKGTGLGLAMVYGMIKSHDGFCDIDTRPGEGTAFSVYLPVYMGEALKDMPAVSEKPAAGLTILIIDDEVLIAETLFQYLQEAGNTVYLTANGLQALEVLQEHRDAIELAILDINMPIMGGEETFNKLMAIKPELKVLVSTGYSLQGKAQEIINSGGHGFIQKPYTLDQMGAVIHQVMEGG